MKAIPLHPIRNLITLYTAFALLLSVPLCIVGTGRKGSESFVSGLSPSEASLLENIVFFGDSTTYHLLSREVLPGGRASEQVWCPKNGTLLLTPAVASVTVSHPSHSEEIPLSSALALYRPKYFVITAGLNGAHTFTEERFCYAYRALIAAVRDSSADTVILAQSIFPVGENESAWTSLTPRELNLKIDLLNGYIRSLAEESGIRFLNTQEVLRDNDGYLRKEYHVGDGIHLSKAGYRAVLSYILASLAETEVQHETA